jgi:hypothetical protein
MDDEIIKKNLRPQALSVLDSEDMDGTGKMTELEYIANYVGGDYPKLEGTRISS